MMKTLLMPNNTTALARLRKAMKEIDPAIKVNGWSYVVINDQEKLMLSISHPFLKNVKENTDLALEIYKTTIPDSKEVQVTINTEADNMLMIPMEKVADLLTQNV
jgi:hypothetical protein